MGPCKRPREMTTPEYMGTQGGCQAETAFLPMSGSVKAVYIFMPYLLNVEVIIHFTSYRFFLPASGH